jgi:hypothetical protein
METMKPDSATAAPTLPLSITFATIVVTRTFFRQRLATTRSRSRPKRLRAFLERASF